MHMRTHQCRGTYCPTHKVQSNFSNTQQNQKESINPTISIIVLKNLI